MGRFILRSVLSSAVTLLGAAVLVFSIVHLTGDPAAIMLPMGTPPDAVEAFRHANGLDRSLVVQFWTFIRDALSGNLGMSIRYQVPVSTLLGERLPATIQLACTALAISILVALPLGVLGGLYRNSWIDYTGRFLALSGQAIPVFYLGILLIIVFGVWLRILPTVGAGGISHLILPGITLAAFLVPLMLRVARGGVLDERQKEYLRTARAQGLSERRVTSVHMLRNALPPMLTVIGMQVGAVLGGSIITEAVFAWPGVGQLLANAISTRDFPVVQGLVLFSVLVVVVVNLVVDVLYAVLDPRIRLS
jgi:peptide/nickel transport system permease protein